MKKNVIPAVLAATAFALMIIVNFLSVFLPINGVTPGEVSDSFPNLFAPAGYTFSIWSLIYILLLSFILYQLGVFKIDPGKTAMLQKIRFYFILSSFFNAAWIFTWHYKAIPLFMLLIVGILICLILIVKEIKKTSLSLKEYLLIRLPFSIYFGWITVATIANATVLFVSLGWNGFGIPEEIWAVIVIGLGTIIGILTILKNTDAAYGLVIIWAYIGILIKHITEDGFAGQYPKVISMVIICIVLLLISTAKTFLLSKKKIR